MKVKILQTCEGTHEHVDEGEDGKLVRTYLPYHFSEGAEQDLPDRLARRLIKLGYAEEV